MFWIYKVLFFLLFWRWGWFEWNGVNLFLLLVQGTTVRVEFGDGTTTADPADEPSISRSFPNTYGQPLAHFLRASAKVADAQIITEHPPIRLLSIYLLFLLLLMMMFSMHCRQCLSCFVWFESNKFWCCCCWWWCRVGIVFCGRQSPGGHNVIWGLHSALNIHNPKSVLLGFLGNLHWSSFFDYFWLNLCRFFVLCHCFTVYTQLFNHIYTIYCNWITTYLS